jgi:hypothetical protein
MVRGEVIELGGSALLQCTRIARTQAIAWESEQGFRWTSV